MNKTYIQAVEAIKDAILQGQYEAAKGVNRMQLAVYFSIGKYISQHTRKGVWGTGALEIISQQLRKELPGLRGFSATNLKNMRLFYEAWKMLDPNSSAMESELLASVTTDDFSNHAESKSKTIDNKQLINSSVAIGEFNKIDIYNTLQIPDVIGFPIEDFFKTPFTLYD